MSAPPNRIAPQSGAGFALRLGVPSELTRITLRRQTARS